MPLLDLIWVMLMWFLFIAWVFVLAAVVTDVFVSKDLGGAAKAGWVLFVIVIPWLGVIVYLIARGESMAVRYREAAARNSRKPRNYASQTPGYSTANQMANVGRQSNARYVAGMDYDTQKARVQR